MLINFLRSSRKSQGSSLALLIIAQPVNHQGTANDGYRFCSSALHWFFHFKRAYRCRHCPNVNRWARLCSQGVRALRHKLFGAARTQRARLRGAASTWLLSGRRRVLGLCQRLSAGCRTRQRSFPPRVANSQPAAHSQNPRLVLLVLIRLSAEAAFQYTPSATYSAIPPP